MYFYFGPITPIIVITISFLLLLIHFQALKNRISVNIDSLEKWEAPEALRKYLPYGVIGHDNDGAPSKLIPLETKVRACSERDERKISFDLQKQRVNVQTCGENL